MGTELAFVELLNIPLYIHVYAELMHHVSVTNDRVQVPVSPGDTVQINPPLEWNEDQWDSPCVIDGTNKGSVVVSPDMLITSTAIATSITCPRRYYTVPYIYRVCKSACVAVLFICVAYRL